MHSFRSNRRAAVVAMAAIMVVGLAVPAHGRSVLEGYRAERAAVNNTIEQLRERREDTGRVLRSRIDTATRRLQRMPGRGASANPQRFRHLRRQLLQERRQAGHRIHRSSRRTQRRVGELQARRRSIDVWISTWGLFERCPIAGPHSVSDNFGITVRLPGVPVHRHMGNDITAAAGTPIVAPFDGYASGSSSELGGLEVRVEGARGYVYNAHLSSYGTLGQVAAGTVIGYVGATGDATTPHNHLEWHPGGGLAVDPNLYLAVSCD